MPAVSEFQFLTASQTPPTEANCFSVSRRCFTPTSMRNSYNLGPLYAANHDGRGMTIAIIDSFGDPNIASDLGVFDTQMGLPHMCGEPGASCGGSAPTFQHVFWNGTTVVKAAPAGSNGAGSQTRNIWALETALDVEWAHSIAPGANIINVTTNPAETLGVQGFPAMMNAEQFIVDHHLADVISQSFAAAEETFASTQSLLNLRHAFISAAAAGITVLGSSGDGGSANSSFTPVKNPHLPVHRPGHRDQRRCHRPASQLPEPDEPGSRLDRLGRRLQPCIRQAGLPGRLADRVDPDRDHARGARRRLPGQFTYRRPGVRHRAG